MDSQLTLGIDIGTTSVKVVIINAAGEILAKQNKDTRANVPSDRGIEGNKQDVPTIINALNTCVAKFNKELLKRVSKIGICGQMHGVLLWNSDGYKKPWEKVVRNDGSLVRYDISPSKVSSLYTWQDSRCDSDFLSSLPKARTHLPAYTGYGIPTLFWFLKNKPEKLQQFNRASTIQDFAVAMLCNLDYPVTSEQNAASWGYFDCTKMEWNSDVLEDAGFPINFLPRIKLSGSIAGSLNDVWHSIPKGTPIGVGMGDSQCSVLSTIENLHDAVLNVSTSAQLSFVAEKFEPGDSPEVKAVEYIPYFEGKFLVVAASLNGGNVLATFVSMMQQWCLEFGFSVPQAKVWEKLLELGGNDASVSSLQITPTLLGERYQPNTYASISNISLDNIGLGQVFRALCQGLMLNIHRMMPKEILQEANISRIVGNGSGLARNKVLQKEVQELYELPLVFTAGGDAAKGAAMAVLNLSN